MVSPRAAKAARRARHVPSSVDKLDPEIRELIGHLRIDKGWTIDQIRQRLIDMGQEDVPSRSALGRHVRGLAEVTADLKLSQTYAEAIAREAGDKGPGQLLDMNAQLLGANMLKLMMAEADGEGIQLGPKEAKEFSEALRNLALMRKTELDTIARAEERAAKKATAEAAEKAVAFGREAGLSAERLAQLRREVLGVK